MPFLFCCAEGCFVMGVGKEQPQENKRQRSSVIGVDVEKNLGVAGVRALIAHRIITHHFHRDTCYAVLDKDITK